MTEQQVNLRESCSQIITLYKDSDMSKKEDDDKFWKYFNEFYTHVDNVKTRYNIEKLFEKLQNIKVDTETQKQIEEQAKIINLKTGELAAHRSILLNYLNIIEIVKEINEKALEIEEGKKTQNIDFRWANRFLSRYYNIIEYAGGIKENIRLMLNILANDNEVHRSLIELRLRVYFILEEVGYLLEKNSEYPSVILQMMSDLDTSINNILKILDTQDKDLKAKVETLFDKCKQMELHIRHIYQQALHLSLPD